MAGVGPESPLARVRALNLHFPRGSGKIRDIENLDELEQLEELDLSFNEIRIARNLGALTNLRVLNLAQNRIVQIDSCFEWLMQLENLNLSGNLLESIPSILGKLESLRTLRLARNKIHRATDLENLRDLHRLSSLTIVGNPCASDVATKDLAIFTIKTLDVLDGEAIKLSQRDAARARFEYSEADRMREERDLARADASRLAKERASSQAEIARLREENDKARSLAESSHTDKLRLQSELDAKGQILDHKAAFASDVVNEIADIKQQLMFSRIDGRESPLPIANISANLLKGARTITSPRMLHELRGIKERIQHMQDEEASLCTRVDRLCNARDTAAHVLSSAESELAKIRALLDEWSISYDKTSPKSRSSLPTSVTTDELENLALEHQMKTRALESQLLSVQKELNNAQTTPNRKSSLKSRNEYESSLSHEEQVRKVALIAIAFGQEQVRYAQAVETLASACLRGSSSTPASTRATHARLRATQKHLQRAIDEQRKVIQSLQHAFNKQYGEVMRLQNRREDILHGIAVVRDSPELDAKFSPALSKIYTSVEKSDPLRSVPARIGFADGSSQLISSKKLAKLSVQIPSLLHDHYVPSPGARVSETTLHHEMDYANDHYVSQLQEELTTSKHDFKNVLKDLVACKEEVRELQADLTETRERESRLEARISEQLVSSRTKDQQLDKAVADAKNCEERAADLEYEVKQMRDELSKNSSNFERLQVQFEDTSNKLKQSHVIKEALDMTKEELSATQTKLMDIQVQLSNANEDLRKLHQIKGDQNVLIKSLCDAMTALSEGLHGMLEIPGAHLDCKAITNDILKSVSIESPAHAAVELFSKTIDACAKHLNSVATSTSKIESKLRGAREQEQRYERVQAALPIVRDQLDDAERRALQATSTANREEERLKSIKIEIEQLQTQHTELRTKTSEAADRLNEADSQAKASASKLRTLTRQVDSLRTQKTSLELQQATLEDTCAASRAAHARATAEARAEDERVNDLRQQARTQSEQLEILHKERGALERELEKLTALSSDASKANAEEANKQREMIRTQGDVERERDRLNTQVQDLSRKVRELSRRQENSQFAADEAEARRSAAADELAKLQRQIKDLPEIMELDKARKELEAIREQRSKEEQRLDLLELARDSGQIHTMDEPTINEVSEAAQVMESLKQVYVDGLRQVQEAFMEKEKRLKRALRHAREELEQSRRRHEDQLLALNDALASEGHHRLLGIAQDLRESVVKLAEQRDRSFRAKDAQAALAEKDAKLLFMSGQLEALQKEMQVRERDLTTRNQKLQTMLEKLLHHQRSEHLSTNHQKPYEDEYNGASPSKYPVTNNLRPRTASSLHTNTSTYFARSPETASGKGVDEGYEETLSVPASGRNTLSRMTRVRAKQAHIHMQEDGRVGIDLVQSQRSAALTLPVHLAPNINLHTMVYESAPRLTATRAMQSPLTNKVRELRQELEAMKSQNF